MSCIAATMSDGKYCGGYPQALTAEQSTSYGATASAAISLAAKDASQIGAGS